MTKFDEKTLDKAVAATRELPEDVQTMVAHEVFDMIEDISVTPRSPADQDEIKKRLNQLRQAVSRDDFMAMLRQYNPFLRS